MIIILMGVSGAGKSTIGQCLAKDLGWSLYEGDDFHPKANIEKMAGGIALSDEDRSAWLTKLAKLIHELRQSAQSAVITCSALKQAYREKLAGDSTNIRFVYLRGSYDLVLERLKKRQGHYMRAGLLKSQFDILEEPEQALTIEITQEPDVIVRQIRQALGL